MPLEKKELEELSAIALKLRKDTIEALYHAGSGHPGGALSMVEILTVLYFREMNIRPEDPAWADRDRLILSKGHACPSYYAALAERGYFAVEELNTLRKPHSRLQGHPCMGKTPGVDMSTGSLGQGLAVAAGMALYGKKQNKDYRVYCIIGDGESEEGEIWETAMSAAHYKLDNLIVFLDANRLQIDGRVDDVMNIFPMCPKFAAFGWNAMEIDGHDIGRIVEAVETAKAFAGSGRPTFIQCNTVKGKGVSFMENQVGWHGSPINHDNYVRAMAELNGGEVGE